MNPERSAARRNVSAWVSVELEMYADAKWGARQRAESIAEMKTSDGIAVGSVFRDQLDEKIHRACILGLDTPGGRQALMKALVTLQEACVSMVLAHGPGALPPAGYPSGDLR